jgi:hypothetical protein
MTQWTPVWRVKIDGVAYTTAVLSTLGIESGRKNIYEQPRAGYVSIELLDTDRTIVPIAINSTITVEIKDTNSAWVFLFGGNVVDIGLSVRNVGSAMFTQTYKITALGALARLPKATTTGVLAQGGDGTQIATILAALLFKSWSEVLPTLTWGTYDATTTWATAENDGYGDIDTPGDYTLAARSSAVTDIYSLTAALATSGLGYLYESPTGLIGYADSTHRTAYLAANGYVELDANQARATAISIATRAGDVRNSVTIKYGAGGTSEVTETDSTSIAEYGLLSQIINTTILNGADATTQAQFYLTLRKTPRPIFDEISFDLTNPEMDDADRNSLLNIFMGAPVSLTNLPANMNGGAFQGFVEGWRFNAGYKRLSVTLFMTPLAYSLQAMDWGDVPIVEIWSSVSPTLDWANATMVA